MIRTLKHILLVFLTIFLFVPGCGNVREYIEQERRPESPSIGNPNFLEFAEGFEGTSEYRLLEISALATVTMAGNERYLYAGARSDNAILVFNISDAQLEHIQTVMDVDSPAYHLKEVNELITFQVEGQHYVATSSFKESGFNIFKVGIDGKLTIIVSRTDTIDINLKYTSYLHVVTHNTNTFLIVGSGVLEHSVLEGKGLSIYKFENDAVTLESTVPLNSNELLPLIADIRSIQTTSTSDPVIFVGSMDRQDNSLLTSYRMDSSGAMTHISSIRHDDVVSEGSVETDDFGYGRPNRYGFYAISALEIFSANENAPVFLLVAGDRIGSVSLFEVSRTDGSLRHIVSILWDFDNGRQEFVSGIFNLLHIYYADTSYLLLPNNTYSMGIYRASASGLDYVNVMYAMPGLHLRNVRAVASVHIDGRYYVFTAGSDRGIGMFKVNGEDDGATQTFDIICTNGIASTVKVSTTGIEKCFSCDNGFGLDGELCREQFDPICTNGIASTVKLFTANTEKCVSCDNGVNLNGDICGGFDPICTNGVVSMVKVVSANTEKCVSCNNGFDLNGDVCSEAFDPICTNGVASMVKIFTANTEKCVSCDNGVDLNGDICGGFDPICTDGVASMVKVSTANIEKCVSCNNGYALKSDETCTQVTVETLAGSGRSGFVDGTVGIAQFSYLSGVAIDGSGFVYVADTVNHSIRKITPTGVVSTLAGTGTAGFVDGTGNVAQFDGPGGVAVDGSGFVYVADNGNRRIRKITPDGVVSTFASTGSSGVAVDGSGNVYVADRGNHRIRKITPGGVISTLAGTGVSGFVDGAGNVARFNNPFGVAIDGSGNVYVADRGNHRIRKITPSGVVSTLAGTGISGFRNGAGNVARFNTLSGVAVDVSGNVYVADRDNHRIRKITSSGVVSTFAGDGTRRSMDGAGNVAQFNNPSGVAVDGSGNVYVADQNNHRIRRLIIESPIIDLICTNGVAFRAKVFFANTEKCVSCDSGFGLDGEICRERLDPICTNGVASMVKVFTANTEKCVSCDNGFDLNGDICGGFDPICTNGVASMVTVFTANTEKCVSCDSGFVLDSELCREQFDPICTNGVASMVKVLTANTEKCVSCDNGFDLNGDICGGFDPICTNGVAASMVKVVTSSTEKCVSCNNYYALKRDETCTPIIVETLAGTGTQGGMNGVGSVAHFRFPSGVVIDGSGNVYVADAVNRRIRKITSGGVVGTLAGTGSNGFSDGAGTLAQFSYPSGVAVDGSGFVYVADTFNHRIRKITSGGVVSTLAGTGTAGFMDGAGTLAQFSSPGGVAVDSSGFVYVADQDNHRIRKITPGGVVSILAGTGTQGGMNGAGNITQFNGPYGVAVDGSGNVYVADKDNHRIRKITPDPNGMSTVTTFAGTGISGFMDGVGTLAQFNSPLGVAVNSAGFVYVADGENNRIRKITPGGVVSTLAGTGSQGFIDGAGGVAQFNSPISVAVDGVGNIYVADEKNHRIRRLIIEPPTLDPICTNGTLSMATVKVFFANTEKCVSCNSGFVLDGGICRQQINPICTNGAPSTVKVLFANTEKCVSCDSYYTLKSDETCAPAVVSTLAGTVTAGFKDGAGNVAEFNSPEKVAVDGSGNIYVADKDNNRIRKITSGGAVSTFASNFNKPRGVAIDGSGNVYVADTENNRIQKITSGGVVSTFAGTGTAGNMDGAGNVAQFTKPSGVAIDVSGNVYVADTQIDLIRKITSGGVVSTFASNFNLPRGVAVDSSGNVYVADRDNHRIRKITSAGVASTLATGGTLRSPSGVAVDGLDNVYIADTANHRIRKVTPGGAISTLAGTGNSGFEDGAGRTAKFDKPYGVVVDGSGNVYVADKDNHRIRKITPQ